MKTILASLFTLTFMLLISACAKSNQPDKGIDSSKLSIATFAGGCFWCVESDFEKVPGVHQVISGFSGGSIANPSYKQVSAGNTGHVDHLALVVADREATVQDLTHRSVRSNDAVLHLIVASLFGWSVLYVTWS